MRKSAPHRLNKIARGFLGIEDERIPKYHMVLGITLVVVLIFSLLFALWIDSSGFNRGFVTAESIFESSLIGIWLVLVIAAFVISKVIRIKNGKRVTIPVVLITVLSFPIWFGMLQWINSTYASYSGDVEGIVEQCEKENTIQCLVVVSENRYHVNSREIYPSGTKILLERKIGFLSGTFLHIVNPQ